MLKWCILTTVGHTFETIDHAWAYVTPQRAATQVYELSDSPMLRDRFDVPVH